MSVPLFLLMSCVCSLHTMPVALGNRLHHDHTGLAARVGGEEGRKGKNLLRQPQQPYHHMDEANIAGTSGQHDTMKSNFSSQHFVFFQDYSWKKKIVTPPPPHYNLKSAVPSASWLKMAPAPQQQHQAELRQWYLHPSPLPLPMPPTTTSMSPKSDDLVVSAPPLSPFPVPWRWELATHPIPLHALPPAFYLFPISCILHHLPRLPFLLRRWTGHFHHL